MKSQFNHVKTENEEMKALLAKNKIKYVVETETQLSSTFVTQGCENPQQKCDNCSKEIDKTKMRLHMAYCLKNTKKCTFCGKPCDGEAGLKQHIDNNKGSY